MSWCADVGSGFSLQWRTVSRDRLASNRLEHRGKVRSRRVDSSISPLSVPSTYPRSVSRTLFLAESSFTQPQPHSPRRSVNIDAPAPVVCHAAMSLAEYTRVRAEASLPRPDPAEFHRYLRHQPSPLSLLPRSSRISNPGRRNGNEKVADTAIKTLRGASVPISPA